MGTGVVGADHVGADDGGADDGGADDGGADDGGADDGGRRDGLDAAEAEVIDPAVFRRAVGRFATGVCVLTTRDRGLEHAMTVNAFTSVSLEPLLVLVCVEIEARFHDAVTASGCWGVSVLDAGGRAVADWLSSRGRPLHGQLDRTPHHPGRVTGVPLLDAASATLECRTQAIHPGGDHSIIVGNVVATDIVEDSPGALLYHRGTYRRLD